MPNTKQNKTDREQAINTRDKNIDGIYVVKNNIPHSYTEHICSPNTPKEIISNTPNLKRRPILRPKTIILAICLVFLLSIVPIRLLNTSSVLLTRAEYSNSRIQGLISSLDKEEYSSIKRDLTSLNQDLQAINKELLRNGQGSALISQFLLTNDSITNNENILYVASLLIEISASVLDNIAAFEGIDVGAINNSQDNNIELFKKIYALQDSLDKIQPKIDRVDSRLLRIDEKQLPDEERKYFRTVKEKLGLIIKYYQPFKNIIDELPGILGEKLDSKYLLLFQNNNELRATGGFIGTYGILTLRDARVKDVFIDSIYNPDGQLTKTIVPPEPLKKVTKNLAMRDSNWDPDLPTAAREIISLYEAEGGFTPDGVILLDTTFFTDLLTLTGPIKIPGYQQDTITGNNFVDITQYETSIGYEENSNNPKRFLADFAPIFLEKIFSLSRDNQKSVFQTIAKNIQEKHLQFFHPNKKVEQALIALGAAGSISENKSSDYFMYVNSNIGGMKTNDDISETLNHQITIRSDGAIIHQLNITRSNNGNWEWPNGINFAYLRFYLPENAKILQIDGFEKEDSIKKETENGMLYLDKESEEATLSDIDIYKEHEKTILGGWQVVEPGQTIVSSITYQIPLKTSLFSSNKPYSLTIQKQAGVRNQKHNIEINVLEAPGFKIIKGIVNSDSSKRLEESFILESDKRIELAL